MVISEPAKCLSFNRRGNWLAQPHLNGHSWAPFRTGVACKLCKQRLHTKSPVQDLRDALSADCPAQVGQPVKRKTRVETIQDIIQNQSTPVPGKITLVLMSAAANARATFLLDRRLRPLRSGCKNHVLSGRLLQKIGRATRLTGLNGVAPRSPVQDATERPKSSMERSRCRSGCGSAAKSLGHKTCAPFSHSSTFLHSEKACQKNSPPSKTTPWPWMHSLETWMCMCADLTEAPIEGSVLMSALKLALHWIHGCVCVQR